MTDWLELILRSVIPPDEESEEPWELTTGRILSPAKATRMTDVSRGYDAVPISGEFTASELPRAVFHSNSVTEPQQAAPGENSVGEIAAARVSRTAERESIALSRLYRMTVEGAEGIAPSRSLYAQPGREQVITVREAVGSASGLTTAELDRAVRRDSRRYDGGMTIY